MGRNENKGPSGKPSVYVRLDQPLSAALDVVASGSGLSRAGWARRAIVSALPASEVASLPPSPARRPPVIPAPDLAEVSKLAGAVARTNGAVVQMTKTMREIGHPFHGDAEAVLADLRATQEALLHVVTGLKNRVNA